VALLAGLLVFVGVLAIGFTTLGLLNPGRLLQRNPGPSHAHIPMRVEVDLREFNQFEIEGMQLHWPSESGRDDAAFRNLPWPSSTWDDPHFGKALTGDMATALELDQDTPQPARQRLDDLRQRAATKPRQLASRAQQEVQQVRERAEEDFFEAVDRGRKKVSKQLGFDPADVPAMVREYGLAGAVERIRKQTGWDFKDAAQFVAKALRN